MTKYKYLFCIIILMLVSCKSKDPIEVKQLYTKEMVVILPNQKNDSISLCLPVELELTINSSKVKLITWNYYLNNKKPSLNDFFDYHLYDKRNNTKPIHELNFDL